MNVMLLLGVLGLICIVLGVSFHLGYFRAPIVYWTTFTSGVYATTPLGLGLLFFSIMTQFPYPNRIGIGLMIVASAFLIIGIVLGLTMPQFLTPWWFRYLRENYDESFIFVLLKDAADNYSSWLEHTQTQDGLEEWIITVRQKHGPLK